MHKNEFIKQLAKETAMPQKQVNQVVKSAIELIARSLREGDKVVLTGFGTFEVRTRRSRRGVNPQTKEHIVIPQTQTPGFTASNTLKNVVLGKIDLSSASDEFDSQEPLVKKSGLGRGRKPVNGKTDS
jgi:DNA-binding protein HU-beta